MHAWSNEFFEQIAGSFRRFVSTDFNTMNMKRLDVARMLIRTSSWEAINRIVKVQINGVFFTIRILEEPFPKFTVRSNRKEVDNDSLSNSLDLLSLGNFSMGSEFRDLNDSSEGEYDIQNLFEDQGVGVLNNENELRLVMGGKAGENVPIIEPIIDNEVHAAVPLEDGEIPVNEELNVQRVITAVDNSIDLVVDLRFSPLNGVGLSRILNPVRQESGSDPILSWSSQEPVRGAQGSSSSHGLGECNGQAEGSSTNERHSVSGHVHVGRNLEGPMVEINVGDPKERASVNNNAVADCSGGA